jgi:parallel beta-helix repeat protein
MDIGRNILPVSILRRIAACKNIPAGSSIIIVIILITTIDLYSAFAYEEVFGFDRDSTSFFSNCSRIMWYQDISDGCSSSPSFRSGPIRNSGVSCFGRLVEGPANLKFYWKLDRYIHIGELSFKVDNDTIVLCRSSDWTPVSYAIASGMHWLSWEYRKQYSYPEYEGAGWVDDIQIVSNKSTYEKTETIAPSNDSIKEFKRDINRFDNKLSAIESKVSDLNESLSTTIGNVNIYSKKVDYELSEVEKDILYLNKSVNLTIGGVNKHIEEIDSICAKIINASNGERGTGDLSWINDHVIFVPDGRSNLSDVLIKNKNKTIILGDGVYYTDGLWINVHDVYLKSLRKWGAKIDAGNNSNGIVIDTANNVTLDSLMIFNCTDGIHIENSSHCNIINNLIEDFNRIGIGIKKSNESTVMNNRLNPRENPTVDGIIIDSSFKNTFALNEINTGLLHNNSFMYSVYQSSENTIYISDNGYIWEDYNPNNPFDDFWCKIWGSVCSCNVSRTRTITNLSVSENIWIHP